MVEPPRYLLSTLVRHPSDSLSEDELAVLWKYVLPHLTNVDDLTTTDGHSLELNQPGEVGRIEGPDVRDAVLTINEVRIRGAVELHVNPADWYHHGHHRDPSFNDVVLQVCLNGTGDPPARREDGRFIQSVVVGSVYEECRRYIDDRFGSNLTERIESVKRPCYVSQNREPGSLRENLDLAGQTWLLHRCSRLRRCDSNRRLFQALVEALGYTRNHDVFRQLGRRLNRERFYQRVGDRSRKSVEAWLLGKAGWLTRPFDEPVNRTIYQRRSCWEDRWPDEESVVEEHRWNRSGIRPQAFPIRRWIYFGLASRRLGGSWKRWMLDEVRPMLDQQRLRNQVARGFLSYVDVPRSSYWARHYTRRDESHESTPSPVGKHWMDQVTVNVVLPWFYLRGLSVGNAQLCERVLTHLRQYPPVLENRRTRRVKQQWGLKHSLEWSNVLEQQGVVHVYKHGCVEQQCETCRFNRRNKETAQISLIDRRR